MSKKKGRRISTNPNYRIVVDTAKYSNGAALIGMLKTIDGTKTVETKGSVHVLNVPRQESVFSVRVASGKGVSKSEEAKKIVVEKLQSVLQKNQTGNQLLKSQESVKIIPISYKKEMID